MQENRVKIRRQLKLISQLFGFLILVGMLWSCASTPMIYEARSPTSTSHSSRLRETPSNETQSKETFTGPTITFQNTRENEVFTVIDRVLKNKGFRVVQRRPHEITYQLNNTSHPDVKKIRVSFKFIQKGQDLHVLTRAKALIPYLSIDGQLMDVSRKEPSVRRFRRLFKLVKSDLKRDVKV